ncbi:citrate synthase [Telmatocola sphagniphila]|uniref:Citrate synthase n=1 Tax=Telmatocola sphagniphila TaxID=1123043 RepID=A0A8E6EW20_9BACT|nr:citrate/2-methylcitrate synthase [Telmatocola sphagniphila]QVL30113.1 citrate synthase [Telmatocola sphagniphila]
MTPAYSPGLEGVIAGETSVSSVDESLRYRGYAIEDLAEHCSYEEVAYLLLYGELPNAKRLADFTARVNAARRLTQPLRDLLKSLPKWTHPLDALRSSVSVLSHFDQDVSDNSTDANLRKAERLIAQLPVAIADYFRYCKGLQPVAASQELNNAANFLYMIRGEKPTPEDTKAFDVSLILYADHEFNASTFTARTIVSTQSDLHSGVVGAIGALKGPLHGGANEKVVGVLDEIGSPANAEKWVMDALARKERIMGFGHRVCKKGDVRAGICKKYASQAAARAGTTHYEVTADIVERLMAEQKKMFPNVDWPAGRLYHALGLEIPIYTPIFAAARVAGWSAHVIEQMENNRLIRPRGLYKGPADRVVPPIAERA